MHPLLSQTSIRKYLRVEACHFRDAQQTRCTTCTEQSDDTLVSTEDSPMVCSCKGGRSGPCSTKKCSCMLRGEACSRKCWCQKGKTLCLNPHAELVASFEASNSLSHSADPMTVDREVSHIIFPPENNMCYAAAVRSVLQHVQPLQNICAECAQGSNNTASITALVSRRRPKSGTLFLSLKL